MSARSLNKVILIGNLTRDPELRYTPSGTAVCTFTVATNRDWQDQAGQRQESTEFTRAVAWSKLAEICAQLLRKGRKVYIEGRLQTRSWQTQDGQDRQTTEVVINEMIALGAPVGIDTGAGKAYEPTVESGNEAEVFVPEEMPAVEQDKEDKKEVKKAKKIKDRPKSVKAKEESVETDKSKDKSKAEEIADEIPF